MSVLSGLRDRPVRNEVLRHFWEEVHADPMVQAQADYLDTGGHRLVEYIQLFDEERAEIGSEIQVIRRCAPHPWCSQAFSTVIGAQE
jgi:hypothetical protein